MARDIQIFEVGPRDGLQNHPTNFSTAAKVQMIHLLQDAGLRKIEVASFVSPKLVPKMADSGAVLTSISRRQDTDYCALVPNLRGLELALNAKPFEIAVFVSASESFSQKNTNCTTQEALERAASVAHAGKKSGLLVRGYVSCVTDCPYEGSIEPERVGDLAEALINLGCYEVSLGDTIGHGTPKTISDMLDSTVRRVDPKKLAAHFHDTRGSALTNIEVALDMGLRTVDTSIGGLGGCPFAPGAAGNADTLSVHERLSSKGWNTGLIREKLRIAEEFTNTFSIETSGSPDV